MRRNQVVTCLVIAVLLMAPISMSVLTDDDNDVDAMGPVALAAVVMAACFFGGAAFGGLFTHFVIDAPEETDPSLDIEEMKEIFAKSQRDSVYYALKSVNNVATGVMPQDAEMIFFTQNYWDQAMEYQVYESWSKDNMGKFDEYCRSLLSGTGLLTAENSYLYTWSSTLDQEFNSILSQSKEWTETGNLEYTDRLSISFVWNGGSLVADNGSESGVIRTDFTQQITTTEDTYVYIDVKEEAENYNALHSGTIYLYDTTTSKKIQNVDTGSYFTLSPGSNDVTNLPGGIYKLPSGASYAGPMISVIGESSGDVNGALVLVKDGQFNVITSKSDTEYSIKSSTGQSWVTNELLVQFNDGKTVETVKLLNTDGSMRTVGYYDELVQQFNKIAENTYNTGKATWMIFDTVEQSSPYIHPSALPVNIKDQDLSMIEKYYIGINMMAQIKEFYVANDGDLKDLELTFSADTLDLYCYGNLYLNGKLWMENVVFTPYVSTSDQHLELGMNTWNGCGFMAVWDKVDNYSSWNGTVTASSPLSPIDSNYQLEIKKIVSHGKNVESIDLKRATISLGGEGDHDPIPTPPPTPAAFDSALLWAIILVELGIILILLGRIVGLEALALCGIVVIVIGVAIPDAISSLILGTFDWGDLAPFAWIQS